ncbi:MAG: hypothetical protein GF364_17000 [Candidatus Lokiarchaeota archaeon]|nr:hypothetical protein [Candidatus Lokiarchaeota archaeon]
MKELVGEWVRFSREQDIIKYLLETFNKNVKDLFDFLRQHDGDHIDKLDKIVNLFEREPYMILNLNSYIKTILSNQLIIMENGSRFIKYSTNYWDRGKIKFNDTIVGYPKYSSIMTDVDHYQRETYSSGDSQIESLGDGKPKKPQLTKKKKETIRKFFDETGWWRPIFPQESNRFKIPLKLPDSITTQELYLLATDDKVRIGDYKGEIVVKQEFFVTAQLPPRIVQGDIFNLNIIISNLTDKNISCSTEYSVSKHLEILQDCSIDENKGASLVTSKNSISMKYKVKAMFPGTAIIRFKADAEEYADTIIEQSEVLPKGVAIRNEMSGLIGNYKEPTHLKIKICSEDYALKSFLTVLSYPASFMIEAAQNLLNYRFFCNEQTASMLYAAVKALKILEKAGQLTHDLENQFERRITSCIQKIIAGRNQLKMWGWWSRLNLTDPFLTCYIHDALRSVPFEDIPLLQSLLNSTSETIFDFLDDGNFDFDYIYGENWEEEQKLSRTQKIPAEYLELMVANSLLLSKMQGYSSHSKNTEKMKKLIHKILVRIDKMNLDSKIDSYLLYLIAEFYDRNDSRNKKRFNKVVDLLINTVREPNSHEEGKHWESEVCPFSNIYLTGRIGALLLSVGIRSTLINQIANYLRTKKEKLNTTFSTLDNSSFFMFFSVLEYGPQKPFKLRLEQKTQFTHLDEETNEKLMKSMEWDINMKNAFSRGFDLYKLNLFRYPYDECFKDEDGYLINLKEDLEMIYELSYELKNESDEGVKPLFFLENQRWNKESLAIDSKLLDNYENLNMRESIVLNRVSSATQVNVGEAINITLSINTSFDQEKDNLVIIEPIPAGLSVLSTELNELKLNHHQITTIIEKPHEISFVLNRMGNLKFDYNLYPVQRGEYTQNPGVAFLMYEPQIKVHSNETKYNIK